MDIQSILRMIAIFAALGATLFYGSKVAGRVASKL